MTTVDRLAYAQDGRLFVAGDRGYAFVFDRARPADRDEYRPSDHAYFTGRVGNRTARWCCRTTAPARFGSSIPVTDQPNRCGVCRAARVHPGGRRGPMAAVD